MSERFIKFIPSEEAFWLMHNKPNAFRLLTHIANTARRINGNIDGLKVGQCHLQHWKKYDLSEQEYRTAKQVLCKLKFIKIIETNRTRQKSTTELTTNSTLVEILDSRIWNINSEEDNDQINDRSTTDQRPINDKQERIRKIKKEEEEQHIAQPAKSPPRQKSDGLSFDFEKWSYIGISEKDMLDWRSIYPHIDLHVEITKSIQWLKANPSKRNKKHWRRFLIGWFQRANETLENKNAYRAASGGRYEKSQRPVGSGNEPEQRFQASRVLKGSNAVEGNT